MANMTIKMKANPHRLSKNDKNEQPSQQTFRITPWTILQPRRTQNSL